MSISGELQQAHLDFFERELWNPSFSLLQVSSAELGFEPRIPYVYPLELILWSQLGSGIGFFNRERVDAVVSFQRSVAEAGYAYLPNEYRQFYDLTFFGSQAENTRAALIRGDIDDANQVRLSSIFLSHMLMNSELMGDRDAVAFLQMITAAPDDLWGRVADRGELWTGSLTRLCTGFARVLAHLDAGIGISDAGPDERDAATTARSHRHRLELTRMLREFQLVRLGLQTPAHASRYFEFAGTIVGRFDSAAADHLDPERISFNALGELILRWCQDSRNWAWTSQDGQGWWDSYARRLVESRRHPLSARIEFRS